MCNSSLAVKENENSVIRERTEEFDPKLGRNPMLVSILFYYSIKVFYWLSILLLDHLGLYSIISIIN